MIRIEFFNTAYWGFTRTASLPYECSINVNAFVGESGSGKTTEMDAVRILLGDARFENNRPIDHYINPISNWAVALGVFSNGENVGCPFKVNGYDCDLITVCVRIEKTVIKPQREYYIFNYNFNNIADLGQNPLEYKAAKISYEDYLKVLEDAGINKTFKRLMLMRPEDVQDIVNSPPNQLFNKIFELKGEKKIQEVHDDTEYKLSQIIEKEKETLKNLQDAKIKLNECEKKKYNYEKLKETKENYSKFNLLLKKRYFYDNYLKIESSEQDKQNLQSELDEDSKDIMDILGDLYDNNQNKECTSRRQKEVKDNLTKERKKDDEYKKEINSNNGKKNMIENEIIELESIKYEPLENLNKELERRENELSDILGKREINEKNKKAILKELQKINDGINPFPIYVDEFRKELEEKRIKYLMVADCISVKREFSDWIKPIEGFLGNERYRIIVSKEDYLEVKKIQEQYQYTARVSIAKKTSKKLNDKLKGKYISLFQSLEINNIDIIGGYLEKYDNVFLVDTVKEGDNLQKEGYSSITRKGLLQDYDGALYLKTDRLVCGRASMEKYKIILEEEIKRVKSQERDLEKKKFEYKNKYDRVIKRIENQKRLNELPHKKEIIGRIKREIELNTNLHDQVILKIKGFEEVEEKLFKEYQEILNEQSNILSEFEIVKSDIKRIKIELEINKRDFETLMKRDTKYRYDLKVLNLTEDEIDFIEVDVNQEHIFSKDKDIIYTVEVLEEKVKTLQDQQEELEIKCVGVTEAIVSMVEPQKKHIEKLQEECAKANEDREEWEIRFEQAKAALKVHVKETMNEYIEEFEDMAKLLGATASGRFDQQGDDYHSWNLTIKIGFDGKEKRPYSDPGFSKGQRAAISIMLLLAAVNNKKDGTQSSIMFLDEPTSRVDDNRAAEIGAVLQNTNIQFFITHQISANLQNVDWIDNAIILSKLKEGQQFADDPIVEYRRK